MALPVTITCAPCCWGVDDVSNPHLPPWERVLDEAAGAGFGGLELGPYGYMPLDAARVGAAVEARGLGVVAGTIFDDLVNPRNRENLLRQTDEICTLIMALPRPETHSGQRFAAPYLTIMDWGHDERDYAAGHSDQAPRLAPEAWAGMIANIRAISELARDRHGVRAVIHPHAGGYLEFEDELECVVEDVPREVAGLCLDTGHLDYSGMDPVEIIRRHALRTDYIHFKDIDGSKYADVMGDTSGSSTPAPRVSCARSVAAASTTPDCTSCSPRSATGGTSPSNRSGTRATPMASSRTWPRAGTSCGTPDSEDGRTK